LFDCGVPWAAMAQASKTSPPYKMMPRVRLGTPVVPSIPSSSSVPGSSTPRVSPEATATEASTPQSEFSDEEVGQPRHRAGAQKWQGRSAEMFRGPGGPRCEYAEGGSALRDASCDVQQDRHPLKGKHARLTGGISVHVDARQLVKEARAQRFEPTGPKFNVALAGSSPPKRSAQPGSGCVSARERPPSPGHEHHDIHEGRLRHYTDIHVGQAVPLGGDANERIGPDSFQKRSYFLRQAVGVRGGALIGKPRCAQEMHSIPLTHAQEVGWHAEKLQHQRWGQPSHRWRSPKAPDEVTVYAETYRKYAKEHPHDAPPFSSGRFRYAGAGFRSFESYEAK